MAKASLAVPNGPVVQIEGTPAEIQELLAFYSDSKHATPASKLDRSKIKQKAIEKSSNDTVDHTLIANQIKESDEASVIAEKILDQRNQTSRVLLPLFIVHEYFENQFALTTGDISKILGALGIKISNSHVADELAGSSSRHVIGDKVKSRGVRIRYKISRSGVQHIKTTLSGK